MKVKKQSSIICGLVFFFTAISVTFLTIEANARITAKSIGEGSTIQGKKPGRDTGEIPELVKNAKLMWPQLSDSTKRLVAEMQSTRAQMEHLIATNTKNKKGFPFGSADFLKLRKLNERLQTLASQARSKIGNVAAIEKTGNRSPASVPANLSEPYLN